MIKNEAIQKWENAIDTQSLSLVKEVYDKKAILLATFSAKEKKGIEEILPYFVGLFKKKNLNVRFITYTTQKIGKSEIISGNYIFSYDGLLPNKEGRALKPASNAVPNKSPTTPPVAMSPANSKSLSKAYEDKARLF